MNASEGIGRIVFSISAFGWLMLATGICSAISEKIRYGVIWPGRSRDRSIQTSHLPESVSAKELRGIGGWLSFFLITPGIISPIRAVIGLAQTLSDTETTNQALAQLPEWTIYKLAAWSLTAFAAALFASAAHRLWITHRPGSVSFAIAALWIGGPAIIVLDYVIASYLFDSMSLDAGMIKVVLQSGFYTIIWTLYLKLSRRVKNTYQDPAAFIREAQLGH